MQSDRPFDVPRPTRALTKRIVRLLLLAGGSFITWLFVIWPPPLWYRFYFPRETSFMAMRGASTITQQLAKNLCLSPSRNPFRKIKEAVTAWRLEIWLPKDRILGLYLNTAEMGDEIWGVEAASQAYFRASAKELSMEQAATLAGLLPFHRSSTPYYHHWLMVWRKNLILDRMMGRATDSMVALPDSN